MTQNNMPPPETDTLPIEALLELSFGKLEDFTSPEIASAFEKIFYESVGQPQGFAMLVTGLLDIRDHFAQAARNDLVEELDHELGVFTSPTFILNEVENGLLTESLTGLWERTRGMPGLERPHRALQLVIQKISIEGHLANTQDEAHRAEREQQLETVSRHIIAFEATPF